MTVDGQTTSKPFEIVLPPNSHGKDADIQSSVHYQLKLRDDITATSDMTNQIEWMRKQLEDQNKTVAGKAALVKAIDRMFIMQIESFNVERRVRDLVCHNSSLRPSDKKKAGPRGPASLQNHRKAYRPFLPINVTRSTTRHE